MNEIDMRGPGTKHEPPRRPAALQGGSELAVVAQPLLDQGFLLGGEVDLPGAAAGIETVKTQRRRSRSDGGCGGARSRGGLGGRGEGGGEFGCEFGRVGKIF